MNVRLKYKLHTLTFPDTKFCEIAASSSYGVSPQSSDPQNPDRNSLTNHEFVFSNLHILKDLQRFCYESPMWSPAKATWQDCKNTRVQDACPGPHWTKLVVRSAMCVVVRCSRLTMGPDERFIQLQPLSFFTQRGTIFLRVLENLNPTCATQQ